MIVSHNRNNQNMACIGLIKERIDMGMLSLMLYIRYDIYIVGNNVATRSYINSEQICSVCFGGNI